MRAYAMQPTGIGRQQGQKRMTLLTDSLRAKLEANGRKAGNNTGTDFWPVVKLFTPLAHGVWLLTEIDPADPDRAFGLCDPGDGKAELDHVSLSELASRFGHLSVRRDGSFHADKPLSGYVAETRSGGRVVA